jgi:hypothetical protein
MTAASPATRIEIAWLTDKTPGITKPRSMSPRVNSTTLRKMA